MLQRGLECEATVQAANAVVDETDSNGLRVTGFQFSFWGSSCQRDKCHFSHSLVCPASSSGCFDAVSFGTRNSEPVSGSDRGPGSAPRWETWRGRSPVTMGHGRRAACSPLQHIFEQGKIAVSDPGMWMVVDEGGFANRERTLVKEGRAGRGAAARRRGRRHSGAPGRRARHGRNNVN